MKRVNESTEFCIKFNAANKEAIDMGLVEEIAPDQRTLDSEERERKRRVEAQDREVLKDRILAKITGLQPGEHRLEGVDVDIIAESIGTYGRGPTYWKFKATTWNAGERREVRRSVDLTKSGGSLAAVSDELVVRCTTKFVELLEMSRNHAARRKREEDAITRTKAFIAENKDWMKYIRGCSVGEYDYIRDQNTEAFLLHEDGRLQFRYTTRTVDQWKQIADMKMRHARELAELETSFK